MSRSILASDLIDELPPEEKPKPKKPKGSKRDRLRAEIREIESVYLSDGNSAQYMVNISRAQKQLLKLLGHCFLRWALAIGFTGGIQMGLSDSITIFGIVTGYVEFALSMAAIGLYVASAAK